MDAPMSPDVAAAFDRLRESALALARTAATGLPVRDDLELIYREFEAATSLARRLLTLEAWLLKDVTSQRDFLATRVAELEAEVKRFTHRPGQTPP